MLEALANAIELTIDEISTYTTGLAIAFKVEDDNTGNVMVEIGSLGAVSMRKADNTEFAEGQLTEDRLIIMIYDGTRFLTNFGSDYPIGGRIFYIDATDFTQATNAITFSIDDFPGYDINQVFAFTTYGCEHW